MTAHSTFYDMTFSALSRRADEVNTDYTVAELLDSGDGREISVFIGYEQSSPWDDHYVLIGKEVIGMALCDMDDPTAEVEILSRDEATAMFGSRFVEQWERVE